MEWIYNQSKIIDFARDHDDTNLEDFPAAFACATYGADGEFSAPDNSTDWFLPSIGMMENIWKKSDIIVTASKEATIKELLEDRFNTIKDYLEYDDVYNSGYTYINKIKGYDDTCYYWGSNEFMSNTLTFASALALGRTVQYVSKKSSTYSSAPIKVRPFLAF